MRIVGLAEFKELLKSIVAERGEEYCYSNASTRAECFYHPTVRINGHITRCIIGEALHRLGVDDEKLKQLSQTFGPARRVLEELGFDQDVVVYAGRVQRAQDAGKSWGEALLQGEVENPAWDGL